jgi:hypothetical protein
MKLLRSHYGVLKLVLLTSFVGDIVAAPVGTAITYQGCLNSAGQPANGNYDLRFTLYDAASGGGQVGSPVTIAPVSITNTNGCFTVLLDFGAVFNGAACWLEIGVRTNGSSSQYTILSTRQPLTPSPYALYAPSAGLAATATTAGAATNLAGNLSGDVTGTQMATVVDQVGGQTATDVASGSVTANAATNANTPDRIVKRDAVGGFSAGKITAASFTGDGAALTGLNASNLVTGTVADGRLSGNVPRLNANQTFSGSNIFAGVNTLTNATNVVAGTFSGNGGGLTNLNASGLASGTVASARLSGTYSSAVTFDNAGDSFTGNGAGLTNLNAGALASGTVPGARLSGTYSSPVTFNNGANSFSGNGAGLTNLSAGNLASGTIPTARLSGTYSSAVTFSNAGNSFSGNRAGLTSLNADGLASGTVPGARLSGTYPSTVVFNNPSNSFTGSGAGLTGAGLVRTTVLDVNCPASGVSYSGTFTKVADIGTFTKLLANSTIEVTFDGRTYVSVVSFGSAGAIFELRVDNTATSNGRARASYRYSEAGNGSLIGVQTSITGIFTGLAATTHTVSMWIQAKEAGGSGTGAQLDPGCFSTDHVVVKELK